MASSNAEENSSSGSRTNGLGYVARSALAPADEVSPSTLAEEGQLDIRIEFG